MNGVGAGRRTVSVGALSRVEGEGGLRVVVRDGLVEDVQLRIYEPPRFFEALLVGRGFAEPPDITSRICGICPVAYQMSACQAIETACGVEVDGPLADLRRLIYCGEWISSHTLHICLLHAPDFLGYPSVVEMAADHGEMVETALELKKTGNEVMSLIGGRAVHPINLRLGGFYRVPDRRELKPLSEQLERGREAAHRVVRWVAGFEFPDFEPEYQLAAMTHPTEYPILQGRIVTTGGIDAGPREFEQWFVEEQVEHSTALHARTRATGRCLLGPLARYSLNSSRLSPLAREAAQEAGLGAQCHNPYRSIVVRAVEVLYACDEALRIIDAYQKPKEPFLKVPPREGTGWGFTEAPRGTLYHRYRIGRDGLITQARIVPPTSQNQGQIEDDLRALVPRWAGKEEGELAELCARAVRNYDPCISCATHMLELTKR